MGCRPLKCVRTVSAELASRSARCAAASEVAEVPGKAEVTAGYSHDHATDLKRNLLEEWADHVKELVQPDKDVGLLR